MTGLAEREGFGRQLRRRMRGDFEVDAWGLDPEVHDAAVRVGRLRWQTDVVGAEHLPTEGPALLLVQRRIGVSELAVVATAVRLATDRRVRTAGALGMASMESVMRRAGGAFAHPDEVGGLLRDRHLVALGLRATPLGGRPGGVDPDLVMPALQQGVPLLPVAAHGNELARRWTVEIAPPIELSFDGGSIAAVEHIERARDAIVGLQEGRR